jgi:hypothetical protein
MSTLMLAASDPPRSFSAACVQRPKPAPHHFKNDAERCAWIVAEFKRRVAASPGVNTGHLARDIAVAAFNVTIADLTGKSREARLVVQRQKVACVIRLLSDAPLAKVSKLIGYTTHSAVLYALKQFGDELAPQLGVSRKGGAR